MRINVCYVSTFAFYAYIISAFQRNVYMAQIGDGINRCSAKRREYPKRITPSKAFWRVMAVVISSASAPDDPASDLGTSVSRRLCVKIIAHSVNDDGPAQNLIDAEAVCHKR